MIISLERENKEVTANLKEGKAKAEKELASLKEVIAQGKNEEIEPILESINHIIVNWGIFFERKHDQEIEEEKRKTQVITGQLEAEKRVVKRVQKQRDDLIAQVEQEHGK
jgi:hypothetical protein